MKLFDALRQEAQLRRVKPNSNRENMSHIIYDPKKWTGDTEGWLKGWSAAGAAVTTFLSALPKEGPKRAMQSARAAHAAKLAAN